MAGNVDPKGPIILAGSVQGSVGTKHTVNGEIPAVVSITRVPGKPKAGHQQQQQQNQPGGLKIRTDLGVVRGGPPPLLRVGGPRQPGLPPMPRLRLGGVVRGRQPPAPSPHHPLANMINMVNPRMGMPMPGGPMIAPGPPVMGLPVIAGSMSLQSIRPRPPLGQPLRTGPQQPLPTRPKPRPTSGPVSRPAQVRTVFVPPPMKMKPASPLNGQATTIQTVRNEANGTAEAAAASAAPQQPAPKKKTTMAVPLPIPIKKEMTDEEAMIIGLKYRNKARGITGNGTFYR